MNRLPCIFVAAVVALLPSLGSARPGPNGDPVIIVGVDVQANGLVTIATDRPPAIRRCDHPRIEVYTYVIDVTTDAGQALYASALFAASSRALVVIQSTGTCTRIDDENGDRLDVENVARIYALVNG